LKRPHRRHWERRYRDEQLAPLHADGCMTPTREARDLPTRRGAVAQSCTFPRESCCCSFSNYLLHEIPLNRTAVQVVAGDGCWRRLRFEAPRRRSGEPPDKSPDPTRMRILQQVVWLNWSSAHPGNWGILTSARTRQASSGRRPAGTLDHRRTPARTLPFDTMHRLFSLQGQATLVTGAGSASGIGIATARLLAEMGARARPSRPQR